MRGQASVVGVALLLGVTVLALAGVTATVGTLVDDATARADADRVASDLQSALRPVSTTGSHEGTVRFAEGRLAIVERDLRILDDGGNVVERVPVDALVFERSERRVAFLAGALVRGRSGNAWLERRPPVTASRERDGVLIVGAPKLNATTVAIGGEDATVRLRTNVSHHRQRLGRGEYAVALETEAPDAFVRAFDTQRVTVTRRDVDGDGVVSVVARYPGRRETYLVVHDVRLEVGDG